MRVLVTGGHGFLGWHTSCRLRALHGVDAVRVGRREVADADVLVDLLGHTDVVLHLAGVNRADSTAEVREGNVAAAESLAAAVRRAARPLRVVYASSVQVDQDTPYGEGKATAGQVLAEAVHDTGGSLASVLLPNLFGEHGRPHYNSFVATFCHQVANGEAPTVTGDREIPLLHAQRAAAVLIDEMTGHDDVVVRPQAEPRAVSGVLELVNELSAVYRRGEIPALIDPFRVDLFNTYRSYTFPQQFPFAAEVRSDERGVLFETVRAHGGTGQSFASTTRPGQTRGDHYHLRKVERFFVLRGEAEIALRRLLDDTVVRFRVSGARPAFVDMPTMWVHNIANVGNDDLVTVFWTDQLLDPDDPDQYPERVTAEVGR